MGFWDRIVEKNKNSFKDHMTGTWRSLTNGTSGDMSATMAEVRAARAEREERERRSSYPAPSRDKGYYSRDRGDGTAEYYIGPNGDITAERPHVHVIHNPGEGRIIFKVTQSDGAHTHTEYLPITASGNEVNAVEHRLRRMLD